MPLPILRFFEARENFNLQNSLAAFLLATESAKRIKPNVYLRARAVRFTYPLQTRFLEARTAAVITVLSRTYRRRVLFEKVLGGEVWMNKSVKNGQ